MIWYPLAVFFFSHDRVHLVNLAWYRHLWRDFRIVLYFVNWWNQRKRPEVSKLSLAQRQFRLSFNLQHSRPQRSRSFWSAPRIATSGQVQHRKSAIHGLYVTLLMLRAKSAKSDWFWSQSIVFIKLFKTGISLDLARGRDSWCWPNKTRPLGTRIWAPDYEPSFRSYAGMRTLVYH